MTFKTTFALALALSIFAAGGSGQSAEASEKINLFAVVSEKARQVGGVLANTLRWPVELNSQKGITEEAGVAETGSIAKPANPLQRLLVVLRRQEHEATIAESTALQLKASKPSAIKQERFGYALLPKLNELRKTVFVKPYAANKRDRAVEKKQDRQARLKPEAKPKPKMRRVLDRAEETRLAARLAHGDVNEFRQNALDARMGPDRASTSWIARTFARFKIQKPVTSDRKYGMIVARYARAYGVPVELAHAVIKVESNYRPNVRGRAGEVGLMQIKPATARMMGYSGSVKDLYKPENNIKYGMLYLAKAYKLGGGTTCGTILKYNAGHAARRMNPISARYCAKVKKHLRDI